MLDVLLDAILDSLKTLPFLFGAFLLMEAAEKHYGKQRQSVKDKIEIPDPCVGCFGAAQNDCEHCEKRKVNNAGQTTGMDNGRSADELRERLSFIKKFI